MHCASCGTANPESADLCATCGARLRSVQQTPTLASPWGGGVAAEADQTNPNLPTAAPPTGKIAGRYELLSILGTGGTGVVYRARDLELSEEIAIKILPPVKDGSGDPARLKREIRAARAIAHPNVIRIFEFGLSDREGYISMEILPGGSLADRLDGAPLTLAEALRISIGVCDGLAAAHAEKIIHRDIKPQNVLFDKAGRPKIVDFGLARGTDTTSNTVGFSGTPQYMSPESAEGNEITEKSDVYSLGVMLFEIFCGRRPFLAASLGRLVTMHTKEKPPAPRSIRPDLPVEIEEVLLRALEKDPASRTQSVAEITAVLRRVQANVAPHDATADAASRDAAPRVVTRSGPISQPMTLVREKLPAAGRGARLWAGAAAALAVAAIGGILAVRALRPEAAPDPLPSPAIAGATASAVSTTTAAPTATAAVTAKPRPATPRPTAVAAVTAARATPAPTRAPGAGRKGTLLVKSYPWVRVVVDGKVIDEQTPMTGSSGKPEPVAISPGSHTVTLTNPTVSFRRDYEIEVKPGQAVVIVVDPVAGTVRRQ